ncbi:uncharacterized protein OCT59_007727 [Rhizophagus irregularis]|nr:hypothetical protein OCT59_007727 [Rhizophagus irregularis]
MILLIYFIIIIGLSCLTPMSLSEKCLDYLSPLNGETKIVDCPMVSSNDKRQTQPTLDNMFAVDFSCLIDDSVLCDKVEKVFVTAGKFITATLNLKAVVSVDAQFLNFCTTYGYCDKGKTTLGSAGPARLLPYQGPTDDKVRLYPQALYKQMNLPEHPQFKKNEILAMFNSNVSYWFEGDPLPMPKRRVDILYVVVHELIHGLGFSTAWNNNVGEALIPLIGPSFTTPTSTPEGFPVAANGQFLESIFDKYIILLPSGKPLTSITDELNKFPINMEMQETEFINSFIASPQFPFSQEVYKSAITQGAMSFRLTKDDDFILETSIVPFAQGSSIAHADLQTYLSTSDFLMMFTYPPRSTLGQMMSKAGSANTTGPIGPKLRLLFEILGYEVKKDYVPPVILSSYKDDGNDSFSIISNISFNLTLFLICILLTFNYNSYI